MKTRYWLRCIGEICGDTEECDKMVRVCADDEIATDAGGDRAQVHKIIRIHRVTDGASGD